MKKFILFVTLCMPAALMAQNGVTVSGLAVDAGTVTFNVSWKNTGMQPVWSDTVWVFVDYNHNGTMERLSVTSATASAGTVTKIPNNDKGVWIAGNARTQGSFSATVKLFTATADLAGACAYASNYPPVGNYTSATNISFTGTPDYKVVLEKNDKSTYTATVGKDESLSIPSGEAALSFTDKTGAPGRLNCMPMTGNIDFTVSANIPKGLETSFAVTLPPSTPNAVAVTYTWSATSFSPSSGTGTPYTPTAPATTGTYPVTLTAHSTGYCNLTKTKDVTVIDCIPPATFTLTASASGFCEGGTGVTFALSRTQSGRSYELYRDGAPTAVATLTGTGNAATFSGSMTEGSYTARVLASTDGYCEAAMSATPVISKNPLPTPPTIDKPNDVCLNSENIVFTAKNYSGSLTWISSGGGVVNNNTVTFAGTATGTKTVTARSAQTYSNAPVCYSGTVTQSAGVNALPTVASSAGAERCGSGTLTLTATPSADAVIDWYDVATGGAVLSGGSATNSFTTPSISASTVYYAEARIAATSCVSASRTVVTATINTVPTINTHPASATTCTGSTVLLTVSAGNATGYQWRKNGSNVSDGTGGTTSSYRTGALNSNATYTVVVGNAACSVTSNAALVTVTTCCTAPGSTVNFTEFNPCPSAATGATWTLQDTRESSYGNTQSYKVKKMADGRIWMVQDLKFGNLCGTTFSGSISNQTGKVSSIGTYYGDCMTNTQSGAGYVYDWAAAINKAGAYYGGSSVGCSGTGSGTSGSNPGACQGICPLGWHLPTYGEFSDAYTKFSSYYGCSGAQCWNSSSQWEGVIGYAWFSDGLRGSQLGEYHSSSNNGSSSHVCTLIFDIATGLDLCFAQLKHYGSTMRCVKNY